MEYVNTDSFQDSLKLGDVGERLSYLSLLDGKDLSTISCWPHLKFPTTEVRDLIYDIRTLGESEFKHGGVFASDRKNSNMRNLMKKLAACRLPEDHDWRRRMDTELPPEAGPQDNEERRNFDFRIRGKRVQVKTDYITFGSRWKHGATENICFEYQHYDNKSGFECEHDYFHVVLPNKHGEPILQLTHDTLSLREYLAKWHPFTKHAVGNFKAVKSVLVYLPHYLLNLSPLEEPF